MTDQQSDWTADRGALQRWAIAEANRERAQAALGQAEREMARCAPGATRYVREHGPTAVEFVDGQTAIAEVSHRELVIRSEHLWMNPRDRRDGDHYTCRWTGHPGDDGRRLEVTVVSDHPSCPWAPVSDG